MKKPIATITELTLYTTWEPDGSVHSCGSPIGAARFAKKSIDNDPSVTAFCIEEQNYYRCHEDDPDGKLYTGVSYFRYVEKEEFAAYFRENGLT